VKDNAPAACARYFEGKGDDPCWAGKPRLPEAMLWQLVPNRWRSDRSSPPGKEIVTDWYERPTEEILKSKPPYDMYTGWYCVEIRPPAWCDTIAGQDGRTIIAHSHPFDARGIVISRADPAAAAWRSCGGTRSFSGCRATDWKWRNYAETERLAHLMASARPVPRQGFD